MLSLEEIGVTHGTGKSCLTCDYLRLYELLFRHWRNKPIQILEIGVQFGNSLRTWRDYFPWAKITGIDCTDNGVKDCKVIIADGYSRGTFSLVGDQRYHIIIDDGSHNMGDQRFFVRHYSHLLTHDGILIVEDVIHSSTIPILAGELTEGFQWTALNMVLREEACRLFIVTRREPPGPQSAEVDRRMESHYAPPL